MQLWQRMIRDSIKTVDQLVDKFGLERKSAEELHKFFQVRINPYYLSLIRYKGDPIWMMCVPDMKELEDFDSDDDPLMEEVMSPVSNITHRYPDRVLFLVTSQCGLYCRFCTRKRKVGNSCKISMRGLESAFRYLEEHTEVRDVILSGGDPLTLTDVMLEKVLSRIRSIKHIEMIRIGTRIPVVLPHRVTPKLCSILKKYHPLYVNTHFNHPWEITPESAKACEMLSDAGIPLGNQMVLMKGINDEVDVVKELYHKLLKIRVRPYYMYMADETKGTQHFRTSIKRGLEIIEGLRGWTSGLAIPHFVIDAPGGGGKIPLLPNYVVQNERDHIVLRNYKNQAFIYNHPDEEDAELFNGNGKSSDKKIKSKKKRKRSQQPQLFNFKTR